MPDSPLQRADAAPASVGDPILDAQAIIDDPSKMNTPEWLAAMQLLTEHKHQDERPGAFEDLDKEMQALRGMSEI